MHHDRQIKIILNINTIIVIESILLTIGKYGNFENYNLRIMRSGYKMEIRFCWNF